MSLMNSMLAEDPSERPTFSDLKAHPWFQGEMASKQEIIYEFK